ncbi:hypothetical protein D3C78_1344740 [compost metagenome]
MAAAMRGSSIIWKMTTISGACFPPLMLKSSVTARSVSADRHRKQPAKNAIFTVCVDSASRLSVKLPSPCHARRMSPHPYPVNRMKRMKSVATGQKIRVTNAMAGGKMSNNARRCLFASVIVIKLCHASGGRSIAKTD